VRAAPHDAAHGYEHRLRQPLQAVLRYWVKQSPVGWGYAVSALKWLF
jgi:hypothetical protein